MHVMAVPPVLAQPVREFSELIPRPTVEAWGRTHEISASYPIACFVGRILLTVEY